MKVGRNDPCPCGSGRKYKACCMQKDLTADRLGLPARMREAAGPAAAWEADVFPIASTFRDDPAARPAALLVVGGGVALHVTTLSRPPAEPPELAAVLEEAVLAGARSAGTLPERLAVRDAEVAAALAELLGPRDVEVVHSPLLPEVDEVGPALVKSVSGVARWPVPSFPETWAAWGLPRERVAELFEAAAAFHRAQPWTALDSDGALILRLPDGTERAATVLGSGGMEFGLALYSDLADLESQREAPDAQSAFAGMTGRVYSVTYEPRSELPRSMQREVAAAGWEVAGPEAYPMLLALNTPGGGVPRRDADLLVALLRGLPRFVAAQQQRLTAGQAAAWDDPETGVRIEYGPPGGTFDSGIREVPVRLEPGDAVGPAASPGAALAPMEEPDACVAEQRTYVERFHRALVDGGLAESTAAKHAANAERFVEFLCQYQGVPLPAVHEFDLRTFLYDWYPRKVRASRTQALAVPTSLRRFFNYLAEHEGIECPWARPLLMDREAFEQRYDSFPGGFWWDEDVGTWRAGLLADLHARAMDPASELATGLEWAGSMGATEARLFLEAQRRWLLWRDELIRAGTAEPEPLRAGLADRQQQWAQTADPALDGGTPAQAIRDERAERAKRERKRGAKRTGKRRGKD